MTPAPRPRCSTSRPTRRSVATPHAADYWCADGLAAAADRLVDQLVTRDARVAPTGLFVAEDRLLPQVDAAFRRRGLRCGPGARRRRSSPATTSGRTTSGCNRSRPSSTFTPRRSAAAGVEQLIWRMRNRDVCERVRTMVDPVLIEPAVAGERRRDGLGDTRSRLQACDDLAAAVSTI